MKELGSVLVLCILLELLSECKLSEKYSQYFSFLTGLIITVSIAGLFLGNMGISVEEVEKKLELEMENWQTYGASFDYEQICEAGRNLEKEYLTEELNVVLEAYDCQIRTLSCEEKISITVQKNSTGKIQVKIGENKVGWTEEEQMEIVQKLEETVGTEEMEREVEILFWEA